MKITMVRHIDELGRVVIPKDLRNQYDLNGGVNICFEACSDGIKMYTVEKKDEGSKKSDKLIDKELILSDPIILSALSIEAESVGVTIEDYVDKFLDAIYEDNADLSSIIMR